jgi:hypothetical protein
VQRILDTSLTKVTETEGDVVIPMSEVNELIRLKETRDEEILLFFFVPIFFPPSSSPSSRMSVCARIAASQGSLSYVPSNLA